MEQSTAILIGTAAGVFLAATAIFFTTRAIRVAGKLPVSKREFREKKRAIENHKSTVNRDLAFSPEANLSQFEPEFGPHLQGAGSFAANER